MRGYFITPLEMERLRELLDTVSVEVEEDDNLSQGCVDALAEVRTILALQKEEQLEDSTPGH